jgi:hypothetical protein
METNIVRRVAAEMMNTSMQDITAEVINRWALRLGDAATCNESRQVGNGVAMRVALIKILGLTDHLQMRFALRKLITEVVVELEQIAEAALAEPPRNCDVGTAEEQIGRWHKFCKTQTNCEECPCHKEEEDLTAMCFAHWSQMPYESEVKNVANS